MSETCQETAGFLFDHECLRPGRRDCAECGKKACLQHLHEFENDLLCTGCARAVVEAAGTKRRFGQLEGSPYFMATRLYPGFGKYPEGSWGHDRLGSGETS